MPSTLAAVKTYISKSPANGELFAEFPLAAPDEIEKTLAAAEDARRVWRMEPLSERASLFRRVAGIFERDAAAIARVISEEMGKPIWQAEAEVSRVVAWSGWFAERVDHLLAPRPITDVSDREAYVAHESLGVVFGITPWNFPVSLILRIVLPALAAGNAVVSKPAPNVPRSAKCVEAAFREAGGPEGLFGVLFLSNEQAQRVIYDRRVRMVSFTGSVEAGRNVGVSCAEALKKVTLELGGSDPFIVLPGADARDAAEKAFAARTANAGQICCAPKRFIVHCSVEREFKEVLCGLVEQLRVGDPLDRETGMGPLARIDLREKLSGQVEASRMAGAELIAQSRVPEEEGCYYPAMVFDRAKSASPAGQEELFGPVFPIFSYEQESEAVHLANQSVFGLGACVFGKDDDALRKVASSLEAGVVALNGTVGVDARIPFGGVKDSGYGRSYGLEGVHELTNVKSIVRTPRNTSS